MATILEYARLSNAVYDDDPQVEGWTRAAFKRSGSGLNDAFQGAAFTRGTERVFACKGTSSGMDVIADLKLGTGMNTSQFAEAQDFVQRTGTGAAGLVTVCGHSLGGAIAQVVGNRERMRFATFNAPGVALISRNLGEVAQTVATRSALLRIAGAAVSVLRHPFQAAEDVGSMFYRVSGVNFRLGIDVVSRWGVHYGQVVDVPYAGGGANPLDHHSMDNFVTVLEALGYGSRSLADLLD